MSFQRPTLLDALRSLRPSSRFTATDVFSPDVYDRIVWDESNTESLPSLSELEIEQERLGVIFDNTEYQRTRRPEYPPITELADALYWKENGDDTKLTEYLQKVTAVKEKYPKP